jgi:uncharacterized protein
MKKQVLLILTLFLAGCRQNTHDRICRYIDTIEIIDTHEHFMPPGDSTDFYIFNKVAYLSSDMVSSGLTNFIGTKNEVANVDSIWKRYGKFYNYCRATSSHRQFMNSLRLLYGYDKPFLVKEDIKPLYDKMILNNYRNQNEWFDSVFKQEKFKTMFLDQWWNHFNTHIDTNYFQLVCRINSCVLLVSKAAQNKKITSFNDLTNLPNPKSQDVNFLNFMNREVIDTKTLVDYTDLVDSVLSVFKRSGAVCLKNSLAYIRSLDFEDVDYADAVGIYNKTSPLDNKEKKKLEDYMFHHIVQQSIKLNLPVQLHTGDFSGNNNLHDYGQPIKLVNLFLKYPKARFILFHGGYPWTSEFVAIGKNFSNVYLDLVWLPQLSKTVAIRVLHEMLDMVPYNKIMWGGDVGGITDAAGSLELGKEVVATVLSERVEKREMTRELAFEIAKRIFHDNAVELFGLNK